MKNKRIEHRNMFLQIMMISLFSQLVFIRVLKIENTVEVEVEVEKNAEYRH